MELIMIYLLRTLARIAIFVSVCGLRSESFAADYPLLFHCETVEQSVHDLNIIARNLRGYDGSEGFFECAVASALFYVRRGGVSEVNDRQELTKLFNIWKSAQDDLAEVNEPLVLMESRSDYPIGLAIKDYYIIHLNKEEFFLVSIVSDEFRLSGVRMLFDGVYQPNHESRSVIIDRSRISESLLDEILKKKN